MRISNKSISCQLVIARLVFSFLLSLSLSMCVPFLFCLLCVVDFTTLATKYLAVFGLDWAESSFYSFARFIFCRPSPSAIQFIISISFPINTMKMIVLPVNKIQLHCICYLVRVLCVVCAFVFCTVYTMFFFCFVLGLLMYRLFCYMYPIASLSSAQST